MSKVRCLALGRQLKGAWRRSDQAAITGRSMSALSVFVERLGIGLRNDPAC